MLLFFSGCFYCLFFPNKVFLDPTQPSSSSSVSVSPETTIDRSESASESEVQLRMSEHWNSHLTHRTRGERYVTFEFVICPSLISLSSGCQFSSCWFKDLVPDIRLVLTPGDPLECCLSGILLDPSHTDPAAHPSLVSRDVVISTRTVHLYCSCAVHDTLSFYLEVISGVKRARDASS